MQHDSTVFRPGTEPPSSDPSVLEQAARLFAPRPDECVGLVALNVAYPSYTKPHTEIGYFDNPGDLAHCALELGVAGEGVYVTLNGLEADCLARTVNGFRPGYMTVAPEDADVARRRFVLIDADPVRTKGVNSSETELRLGVSRACDVWEDLLGRGFGELVVACSGNGGHLLVPVDLPADDGGLVAAFLAALAARFDTRDVKIDPVVHNPGRLCRCYGTVNKKGDHHPRRPQRRATLIHLPDGFAPTPRRLIEAVAAEAPKNPQAGPRRRGRRFDVDAWVAEHLPDARGPAPYQGGRKWVLPVCPWDAAHSNAAAYVIELESGAVAAGCLHASCRDKGWQDLRDLCEPGRAALRPPAGSPPAVARAFERLRKGRGGAA